EEQVPPLAGARAIPGGEGDLASVAGQGRPELGIGRIVDRRQIDQLLFLPVPQADAAGLVLLLGGEGDIAAVRTEAGAIVAPLRDGRNVLNDLARSDPVVLVEVDLRM